MLLKREIYVSAALVGASAFVVLNVAGVPQMPAALAGFAVGLAVRAGAILFRWSLPGFPGRTTSDEAD